MGKLFAVSCPAGPEYVLRNVPTVATHHDLYVSQGPCDIEVELFHSTVCCINVWLWSSDPHHHCFCAAVLASSFPQSTSPEARVPLLECLVLLLTSYPASMCTGMGVCVVCVYMCAVYMHYVYACGTWGEYVYVCICVCCLCMPVCVYVCMCLLYVVCVYVCVVYMGAYVCGIYVYACVYVYVLHVVYMCSCACVYVYVVYICAHVMVYVVWLYLSVHACAACIYMRVVCMCM